ncbi:DUF106 domain-containing protein [Candidatus Micrarchaeota archaeon]|nr:DUF106 domain-containing protein [Candidatus Micrarchaeota archaeon]
MVLEYFAELVGVLAIAYAGIAKFLQSKLIDKSIAESVQAKSKKLNQEFKKAKEKGNQAEMEKIMKKQMDILPEMNKVMFAQFKPMIIILIIFFAFTWIVNLVDPTGEDDFIIRLYDDGKDCDAAVDGIYSGCFELDNSNYGKWGVTVHGFRNGVNIGSNSTFFSYNQEIDDSYIETATGEAIAISTDRSSYAPGEKVFVFAQAENISKLEATIDNGTSFRVDLPVTIPLLNVQRIYHPYWWFILISLIANLSLSLIISQAKKRGYIK